MPESGVTVELSFTAVPSYGKAALSRCIKIVRSRGVRDFLDVEEVSCD
jgi:hypothetical protein